jgi:hypothetical protein
MLSTLKSFNWHFIRENTFNCIECTRMSSINLLNKTKIRLGNFWGWLQCRGHKDSNKQF